MQAKGLSGARLEQSLEIWSEAVKFLAPQSPGLWEETDLQRFLSAHSAGLSTWEIDFYRKSVADIRVFLQAQGLQLAEGMAAQPEVVSGRRRATRPTCDEERVLGANPGPLLVTGSERGADGGGGVAEKATVLGSERVERAGLTGKDGSSPGQAANTASLTGGDGSSPGLSPKVAGLTATAVADDDVFGGGRRNRRGRAAESKVPGLAGSTWSDDVDDDLVSLEDLGIAESPQVATAAMTPTPAPTFSPTPTPAPTPAPRASSHPSRVSQAPQVHGGIGERSPGAASSEAGARSIQPPSPRRAPQELVHQGGVGESGSGAPAAAAKGREAVQHTGDDSVVALAFPEEREVTPGWRGRYKVKVQPDGTFLVDERYVVAVKEVQATTYEGRAEMQVPKGWEEFLQANRPLLLALAGAWFLTLLTLVAHWPTGLVLLLITLGASAGVGGAVLRAQKVSEGPDRYGGAEEVVRAYFAALRLGLYHRAKRFLAVPREVASVSMDEVMDTQRGPLGPRFNTLVPAALRMIWRQQIKGFDHHDHPLWQRLVARVFQAEEVDTEVVLRSRDGRVVFVIVRGGGADTYAVVPVVSLKDACFVADGEALLHATRLELVARLDAELLSGQLTAEGYLAAVRRNNITQMDLELGLQQGLLSERAQAILREGGHVLSAGAATRSAGP